MPPSDLAAATVLLTRLPVRAGSAVHGVGAAWFPLVGALLGAVAAGALAVLAPVDPMLAAIAALAVLAGLSGALHLDGLADTADALLAPDPHRAEAARRDPRVGAGGAVALVLVLAAEAAALASALRSADVVLVAASLVAITAAARLVPVLATRLPGTLGLAAKAAPEGGGFGAWFAARIRPLDMGLGVLALAAVAAGLVLVTGSVVPAVSGAAAVGIGTVLAAALLARRGAIDGDLLGAATELSSLAGMIALAVLLRVS